MRKAASKSTLGFRSRLTRATVSVLLCLLSLVSIGQTTGTKMSVPAARQARNVAVITIKGAIDGMTAQSVGRRLRLAERAGADAIVLDLDTPGGEVTAVLAISTLIKGSRIDNTVAWINPQALSGGAIIAWASREIVAAPNASVGDALAVTFDQQSKQWTVVRGDYLKKVLPPLMADLTESARMHGRDEYLVQAFVSDSVELWLVEESGTGRRVCIDANEYRAIFGQEPPRGLPRLSSTSAVSPAGAAPAPASDADPTAPSSPESAAPEPEPQPLIDPLDSSQQYKPASPDLEGFARAVDRELDKSTAPISARPVFTAAERGKWRLVTYVANGTGPVVLRHGDLEFFGISAATIRNDEELKTFFGARHLIRLDQTWSEGMVWFLTLQPVQGLLLVIFLLALFVEMTHPGVTLPGIVAALALFCLVAPPLLIDLASWWEVAAILIGIVLIAVEVFVLPGFGIAGALGLVLLFGGLVGLFIPAGGFFPDSEQHRHDLVYAVVTLALSVATAGAGFYFIARNFKSLPIFGHLVLRDASFDEGTPGDDLLAAMAEPAGRLKIGTIGTAMTPLRPAGRMELADGRIIDVVAELGYIPSGSKVRIVSVSDFRIGVEPADDTGGPAGEARA